MPAYLCTGKDVNNDVVCLCVHKEYCLLMSMQAEGITHTGIHCLVKCAQHSIGHYTTRDCVLHGTSNNANSILAHVWCSNWIEAALCEHVGKRFILLVGTSDETIRCPCDSLQRPSFPAAAAESDPQQCHSYLWLHHYSTYRFQLHLFIQHLPV